MPFEIIRSDITLIHEAVSEAVWYLRASKPMAGSWREAIDADCESRK